MGPRSACDEASSARTPHVHLVLDFFVYVVMLSLLFDVQARALDAVLKEVNMRFGKGSIMKLGSTPTKVYAPLYLSLACLTLSYC